MKNKNLNEAENPALNKTDVSGPLQIAVASIRSNFEMWRKGEIKDGTFSWHLQNNLLQIEKELAGNEITKIYTID